MAPLDDRIRLDTVSVKVALLRADMTQHGLARALGWGDAEVSQAVRGWRLLRRERAERLASKLGVALESIVDRANAPEAA